MPQLTELPPVLAPRRKFLHGARNVGMLSAALSWFGQSPAVTTSPLAVEAPATAPNSGDAGYRETDHIRKDYAAARYF